MRIHLLCATIVLALLGGCGGGGAPPAPAAAPPPPEPQNQPATATIDFPPAATLTSADVIRVRGTCSDGDGVTQVYVNSTPAVSDDGFATWTAVVPLLAGDNRLSVSVTDARGATTDGAAVVDVTVRPGDILIGNAERIAFDAGNDRLLVADNARDAVLAVDPDTGVVSVLSPLGLDPYGIAVDDDRGVALITSLREVVSLRLDNGATQTIWTRGASGPFSYIDAAYAPYLGGGPNAERITLLSRDALTIVPLDEASTPVELTTWYDSPFGPRASLAVVPPTDRTKEETLALAVKRPTGWALENWSYGQTLWTNAFVDGEIRSVAVDPVSGDVFAINATDRIYNSPRATLLRFDALNWARSVVSSDVEESPRGSGPPLAFGLSLCFDSNRNRAVVLAYGERDAVGAHAGILTVDPATGDRAVLHEARRIGSGSRLDRELFWPADDGETSDVAFDPVANRAVVYVYAWMRSIRLADGNRGLEVVRSYWGSALNDGFALDWDAASGRVLVVDHEKAAVFWIDGASRGRLLSGDGAGSGPGFIGPSGVALDVPNNRAFVADYNHAALFSVDLETGERRRLSYVLRGKGPYLTTPVDVAFDALRDRAFVLQRTGVLTVDPETGNRTRLSDAAAGSGVLFRRPERMVIDPGNDRLIVTDAGRRALIAVDIETGRRTELSSASAGRGPEFAKPVGVTLVPDRRIALVLDVVLGALFAVDLDTGDRVVVSR